MRKLSPLLLLTLVACARSSTSSLPERPGCHPEHYVDSVATADLTLVEGESTREIVDLEGDGIDGRNSGQGTCFGDGCTPVPIVTAQVAQLVPGSHELLDGGLHFVVVVPASAVAGDSFEVRSGTTPVDTAHVGVTTAGVAWAELSGSVVVDANELNDRSPGRLAFTVDVQGANGRSATGVIDTFGSSEGYGFCSSPSEGEGGGGGGSFD